ncbi:MAG: hypothetical protein AB8E15_11420 [Bdellovibrionales bacterium]
MKSSFFVIILGLLMLSYQNCSNPITFSTEELSLAESNAVDTESSILDGLPDAGLDQPSSDDMEREVEDELKDYIVDKMPEEAPPIIDMPPPRDRIPEFSCLPGKILVQAYKNKSWKGIGLARAYDIGKNDSIDNINYIKRKWSVFPKVGPEIDDSSVKIFLTQGADGLQLNVVFNQDVACGASDYQCKISHHFRSWNHINWKLRIANNNLQDDVTFKEEPGTKRDRIHRVENRNATKYDANFSYLMVNTDAFIIGPLDRGAEVLIQPHNSLWNLAGSAVHSPIGGVTSIPTAQRIGKKLQDIKLKVCD